MPSSQLRGDSRMKRIWLVRHAHSRSQSGEDPDGRNPELSELGKRQALRLTTPLTQLEVDCIVLSPLKRAWTTFQIAGISAPHVEFDSRLAESDWGISGYYADILPLSLPPIAAPDPHHALLTPVEERAAHLLNDLLARDHQNVLLFGHWGIFGQLFRAFVGLSSRANSVRATMDNTALSLFEIDEDQQRYIRLWNERMHVLDLLHSSDSLRS
ncbi:hypothetical protein GF339_03945 [candidate division KSB3 bacterium]|uniref:Histidine phosphatase family protein n=1 Tax=candidate division KSB3 bacterium TaxID=2044937 RepID=A0A9D5JU41_9BACT|nr:hypothetical protein [candidate division KSB3 bacterium]MBD3323711.1 hypothetical protein [candidate division KSB3 bacterium]